MEPMEEHTAAPDALSPVSLRSPSSELEPWRITDLFLVSLIYSFYGHHN